MLCGVGGRTIAEAKQRMSYAEFRQWRAYRELRGSFNLGQRVEFGSALLASLYASRRGGEVASLYDFAPHHDKPEPSLEQAMKEWE